MRERNPFALFHAWFDKALGTHIEKANAMTLATVDAGGRPAARIVLLSSFDERGFVFHTNYQSRKGEEIARHPEVALTFWWDPLGYQVRIEGRAEKTGAHESDIYFANRPRGSQLGAWASDQSRPVASRAALERRMHELERQYKDRDVPRPPHWGGYRVVPRAFEFWENRDDRLHDRLHFERAPGGEWRTTVLAP
jgi:pyridoxamine 5'-phosphate oxidase